MINWVYWVLSYCRVCVPITETIIMPQPRMMVVVTGDDFGYCPRRNRGIVECFQAGGIATVSLLVNASATKEAADLANRYPTALFCPSIHCLSDTAFSYLGFTERSHKRACVSL